jgi:hypothetical protein
MHRPPAGLLGDLGQLVGDPLGPALRGQLAAARRVGRALLLGVVRGLVVGLAPAA